MRKLPLLAQFGLAGRERLVLDWVGSSTKGSAAVVRAGVLDEGVALVCWSALWPSNAPALLCSLAARRADPEKWWICPTTRRGICDGLTSFVVRVPGGVPGPGSVISSGGPERRGAVTGHRFGHIAAEGASIDP